MKVGPSFTGPLVAGDPILYAFTIYNTGTTSLDNVTIIDLQLSSNNIVTDDAIPAGENRTYFTIYSITPEVLGQ
jgi:hypothetical protein